MQHHIVLKYFLLFLHLKLWICVCREWLEDAMKENDPSSVLLFLVGTKKDLSVGETMTEKLPTEITAEPCD